MEWVPEDSERVVRQRPRGPQALRAGILLCTMALMPVAMHAQEVSEYALKAAFLYNFAKFVQWPSGAFSGPSAPLVLCTYESNKVGNALKNIVNNKKIRGRTLAVRKIQSISASKACQVLFVGRSASGDEQSILAAIGRQSILVVGETPKFAKDGGAISFLVQDNRLRFAVNLRATDTAGLKLSSKLLSLAILAGT